MTIVTPEEAVQIQARVTEIINRVPPRIRTAIQRVDPAAPNDSLWYIAQLSLQPACIPPWLYQTVPLDAFEQLQDFAWACTPVPEGLHRDPAQLAFMERVHSLKLAPGDVGIAVDNIDYRILHHLKHICRIHENMMWPAVRDSDQPKPIRIQWLGNMQHEHIVWHWNPFGTGRFDDAKDATHICYYPHDQSRARFRGSLMADPLPPTVLRYPRTTENAAPITERLECVNRFIDDNGGIDNMCAMLTHPVNPFRRCLVYPDGSRPRMLFQADVRLALTEREILTRWLAVRHGEHARRQRIDVYTHGVLSDELVDMTASKISFTTADFVGRRIYQSIGSAIYHPPRPDDPPLQ